jgi:hypothetical protein
MSQLVIRALSGALFVGSCFLVAEMSNQWADDLLRTTSVPTAALVDANASTARHWAARKPILDRNLFGARLVGAAEEVDEIVEEEIEETKLPLTLLATIAALETGVSRAAIHDKRSRSDEVVRSGDVLENHPNVTVDRIDRGRILLLNRGRREELTLADAETILTTRPAPQLARARGRASRAAARRPGAPNSSAAAKPLVASKITSSQAKATQERLRELARRAVSGELSPEELQVALRQESATSRR